MKKDIDENNFRLFNDDKTVSWFFSKEPLEFCGATLVKFKDGEVAYYTKYLHREDGPARENHGYSWLDQYYWHGECIYNITSRKQFEKWKKFKNFR